MSALVAVLAFLLGVPPFSMDRETDAERRARLTPFAEEVAALHGADLQAEVLTTAIFESRLARYVGEGRCKDGPPGAKCDEDERGNARALGYLQLWRSACPEAWTLAPGRERMRAEVRCAADRLVELGEPCAARLGGPVPMRALAAYRSGCDDPAGRQRYGTFLAARDVLQRGGWPSAPSGWVRFNGQRPRGSRSALEPLLRESVGYNSGVLLGGQIFGALIEWHWTEGLGFHKGVSLFEVP